MTLRIRRAVRLGTLLLCVSAAADAAYAQTSLQIPLQFDFINPGAKSKAMGGAFVGVADDATATFANPAGLMQLARPEVSFEGRHSRFDTRFLERGRLSGPIFNEGTDTVQGPRFGTSTGSDGGIGFLSVVYARPQRAWRLAGYRHELVRVDQSFLSNGVFQKAPEEFTSRRDTPQEGIRHVSVTGYGVAGAYRLPRRLSIGGGLAVYSFSLLSQFRRFDTEGFLGAPNLAIELGRSSQTGDDTAIAANVGALFEVTQRARVGATYRHGPSFRFRTRDGNDPEREGSFRVPGTFAVGGSYQATSSLTAALEVTRVQFSRLNDDFVTDQARAVRMEDSFAIESGTEIHAGVQYLPLTASGEPKYRVAPAFRGGVWYDPDHSVQFDPQRTPTTIFDRLFDERLGAALAPGKGLVHYTAGIGLSFTPRLEINAALDWSSRSRVWSASVIVR